MKEVWPNTIWKKYIFQLYLPGWKGWMHMLTFFKLQWHLKIAVHRVVQKDFLKSFQSEALPEILPQHTLERTLALKLKLSSRLTLSDGRTFKADTLLLWGQHWVCAYDWNTSCACRYRKLLHVYASEFMQHCMVVYVLVHSPVLSLYSPFATRDQEVIMDLFYPGNRFCPRREWPAIIILSVPNIHLLVCVFVCSVFTLIQFCCWVWSLGVKTLLFTW